MRSIIIAIILLLTSSSAFATFQDPASLNAEAKFLTGSLMQQGNGGFQTINAKFPVSYVANNINYFGDYVCSGVDCNVTDVISNNPYAIAPAPGSVGGPFQEEREFSVNGANIYDAATWQIGVALAAANNAGGLSIPAAQTLVDNQIGRLDKIASRATACTGFNPNTNTCSNGGFAYGYGTTASTISNLEYAYGFRMLGPSYIVPDPFTGSSFAHYVTSPAKVTPGSITWADWKPISGENGWAFLLGPVQAANILAKGAPLSPDNLELKTALNFLWPLQRMQSPIGAFYYATAGSAGNTGTPVPPGEISVENNVSILGGLNNLQKTIQAISGWQNNPKLSAANNVIDIMIYGGSLPQGGTTAGVVSFLKNYAFDKTDPSNPEFVQGGVYQNGVFTPTLTPFALDVQTWGLTALGPKTIDAWFGTGAAFKIWQTARTKAGYFGPDKTLWGVGYTDQSTNSDKVMSGEWSAGAINAVESLITYYQSFGVTPQLKQLQADQASMLTHLLDLRTDNYPSSIFYKSSVPLSNLASGEKAVLYASERYNIPFGWYTNPVPSAASTTWTMMLSYGYNPFGYQGSLLSNDFTTVPNYNKTANQLYVDPNSTTILNELTDSTTQDYLLPVTISYNTKSNPAWIKLLTIGNGSFARVVIPSDAQTLSVSYEKDNHWYSACQLSLTPDILKKLTGDPLNSGMIATWVAPNGMGACPVLGS